MVVKYTDVAAIDSQVTYTGIKSNIFKIPSLVYDMELPLVGLFPTQLVCKFHTVRNKIILSLFETHRSSLFVLDNQIPFKLWDHIKDAKLKELIPNLKN